MREIKKLIVHCSATPPHMDIGATEIRKWHLEKGWADIGYHFVIRRNGDVEDGRPVDQAGAHTQGYNRESIGICLVGGNNEADFSFSQYHSLVALIEKLKTQYGSDITVHGHREFADKLCPCFDVKQLLLWQPVVT